MSPSEERWHEQKTKHNASNESIDELMELSGLEEIKELFLDIRDMTETAGHQEASLRKTRFNVNMFGNPGTGKLTSWHV